MKVAVLVAATLAAASQVAWAQSKLPPCPGQFMVNKWSNCFGTGMTNSGAVYQGEWVNNKFEGRGSYTYRNNSKYVGEFRNNQRNGQGTFSWPDGASYAGGYKDDLRSGNGTFTYPNGVKFVGEYRDDMRNGQGTEYGPDGSVLRSGTWKDDLLVKPQ